MFSRDRGTAHEVEGYQGVRAQWLDAQLCFKEFMDTGTSLVALVAVLIVCLQCFM